ncbi:hypothetical protein EBR03_08585 [bacterium]|nr:hypothetical protein [bacterium]
MVDPDKVDEAQHVRLQTALVKTDRWTVIDRKDGFSAIKKEQDREHRNDSDRFSDQEKWAQWGQLYGVGAILVPHVDCYLKQNLFSPRLSKHCVQFLRLVDANTAEVILAVEGSSSSVESDTPDWYETVEKLGEEYPTQFTEEKISERLIRYKKQSEARAIAQKPNTEKVIKEITH